MALAEPPRGLRVKKANVFASMASAVFHIARYPFDVDKWHPMVSIVNSFLRLSNKAHRQLITNDGKAKCCSRVS